MKHKTLKHRLSIDKLIKMFIGKFWGAIDTSGFDGINILLELRNTYTFVSGDGIYKIK